MKLRYPVCNNNFYNFQTHKTMSNIVKLSLTLALLALFSCSKKEGAVDHRYRIDNIVAEENHYQDTLLFASIPTYLEEDWQWDGNELYRIDYLGDHAYSENFFLDNRNRITQTTIPAYNIMTVFHYDGRKLDRIDIYNHNELYSDMRFVHNDKRLDEIVCNYYMADTSNPALVKICDPIASLFKNKVGTIHAMESTKSIEKLMKANAKQTVCVHYSLTWDDDNVTAINCSGPDGTYAITLTYDDKRNPYSQLFGYREITDPIYGFEMLSENNILTITMPYKDINNQLFTYTYQYDGKYPSRRTLTYSYPSINATFDSVTYKYERTETFNYIQ